MSIVAPWIGLAALLVEEGHQLVELLLDGAAIFGRASR